jgi:hypothetical protein
MKAPKQCPLVLLVKVGWRGRKASGCEDGREEGWIREISGTGLHRIQLQPRVQTLNLERAAYVEILIFIWGRLLGAKFLC